MNPIYGTIHSCNIIPRQERAWDKAEATPTGPTPPSDQFEAWMSIRVYLHHGQEIPIGGGIFIKSAQPEALSLSAVADFLRYENITAETIQQSLNELALVKATFNGDDAQADAISRAETLLRRLRNRVYGGDLATREVYQPRTPMNGVADSPIPTASPIRNLGSDIAKAPYAMTGAGSSGNASAS